MSKKEMTVKEIKEELDQSGIEYDDKLKKDDLLKLLDEQEVVEDEVDADNSTEEVPNDEEETESKTYVTVHRFKDLEDNNRIYREGDYYPRNIDTPVSDERIAALSSKNNKIGKVLIKEID